MARLQNPPRRAAPQYRGAGDALGGAQAMRYWQKPGARTQNARDASNVAATLIRMPVNKEESPRLSSTRPRASGASKGLRPPWMLSCAHRTTAPGATAIFAQMSL